MKADDNTRNTPGVIAKAGDFVLIKNRFPHGRFEGSIAMLLDDLLDDGSKARVDFGVEVGRGVGMGRFKGYFYGDLIKPMRREWPGDDFDEVTFDEVFVPDQSAIDPQTYEPPAWMRLPYVIWKTTSGQEIIVNRSYQLMWQRDGADGPVERARQRWVDDMVPSETEYLFDDFSSPTRDPKTIKRCELILQMWGVTEEMRFALPTRGQRARVLRKA
jgi:hypothetical protein